MGVAVRAQGGARCARRRPGGGGGSRGGDREAAALAIGESGESWGSFATRSANIQAFVRLSVAHVVRTVMTTRSCF